MKTVLEDPILEEEVVERREAHVGVRRPRREVGANPVAALHEVEHAGEHHVDGRADVLGTHDGEAVRVEVGHGIAEVEPLEVVGDATERGVGLVPGVHGSRPTVGRR
jgi:hypothetical protein